ncbi:DUF4238 domain-containing protein [Microbacterium sp. GXF0217]
MAGQTKHHTVPRTYLSGFSSGLQLTAVSIHTGKTHGVSIRDATVLRNFYTVPEDDANPNSFEDALGAVETPAGALLQKIAAGQWPLTEAERATFAVYLTLQYMRGPDHRRQLSQLLNAELRHLAESAPDELSEMMALPGAPLGLDLLTEELPASLVAAAHLTQISTWIPRHVEFFLLRRWQLVRFSKPSLITSDAPITPFADPAGESSVALGIANLYALLFPVNRYLGLQMYRPGAGLELPGGVEYTVSGHADSCVTGDETHVKSFNMNTVAHAMDRVFHHPADAALLPSGFIDIAKLGGRVDFAADSAELPPAG